jgi:hypothetical protein
MFLADIVPLDSIGRRETPPAAPPGQGQGQPAAPGRRSKPLPVPVTEKVQAVPVIHPSPLQWQPIPVADESPEEREVRWGAAMIMMTALKGRADPKGFLRAIPPCDPAVEEWQLPVMDPEDDYGGAIREIEKFC